MTATLEQLKEQCAALSPEHQAELIDFLLQEHEVAAAWKVEIRRRTAEIRAGQVTGRPASEVFAEVCRRYA